MTTTACATHQQLLRWIDDRWQDTVRCTPEDTPDRYGLPHPYIVPCASKSFQDFFYWDSVFAGFGLILTGHADLARNCCEDMFALIRRFGFMPNAAKPITLNRSQPPLLGFLVEALTAFDHSDQYALDNLDALDREYDHWMTERLLPCGLNHYGHNATEEYLYDFCGWCAQRIHRDPPTDRQERLNLGAHLLAEAESGWDFNTRFGHKALDYAPVDLNAILHANEVRLMRWHNLAGHDNKARAYAQAATRRRSLIHKLCYSPETACFHDYNAKEHRLSPLISAAAYFPLWCGCLEDQTVADRLLDALKAKLRTPYGVMSTELLPEGATACQWDAPSLWPPLQIAALMALKGQRRNDEACQLAMDFSECVLKAFNDTGDLWEKYDGLRGGVCTVNAEYGTPAMMGWTAASYILCRHLLGDC